MTAVDEIHWHHFQLITLIGFGAVHELAHTVRFHYEHIIGDVPQYRCRVTAHILSEHTHWICAVTVAFPGVELPHILWCHSRAVFYGALCGEHAAYIVWACNGHIKLGSVGHIPENQSGYAGVECVLARLIRHYYNAETCFGIYHKVWRTATGVAAMTYRLHLIFICP